jgi:hypothetical protein
VRLLDEEGHDAAEGRLEQPAAEPVQGDERDQDPKREVTGGVDRRQGCDHERPRAVGPDQQQLARVPVGEHPADQKRCDEPEGLHHQHDPE